ncbi:hypothetical protein [Kitasatospora sp. MAP5-34]|uniref:hypothetical protein n=1 Tax=Kitasatospora sp. MAP5-34 TaxID=3035102 RepID=UPI002475180B|nr:hypothetical protein [Kitasatospora sp. MAP5-34]MDH6579140.1 hypothetical protein [Kitasatospora sp. MAP5-34]
MSTPISTPISTTRAARSLGIALALASADPVALAHAPRLTLLVPVAAVAAAWWASPVVADRPVRHSWAWGAQLSRHRNTVFAAGCVLLAAASSPPLWLAACVTALLLGYLLLADAVAAGPAGARQWRSRAVPAAAYGASALVLLAAFAPVGGVTWGRLVAALAVVGSAVVAGLALWSRGIDPP